MSKSNPQHKTEYSEVEEVKIEHRKITPDVVAEMVDMMMRGEAFLISREAGLLMLQVIESLQLCECAQCASVSKLGAALSNMLEKTRGRLN